jgi:ribonucleoside-diphosphate reductase beta chain
MGLLQSRVVFAPFEYPEAYEFWLKQQQAHWLHTEVAMGKDINDWEKGLTDGEKEIVGNILKSFTQLEVVVGDYWMNKVGQWFPKPELAMMAACFASMESIHAKSYAYLNETLGLEDYEAFLHEPTAVAKLDNLIMTDSNELRDIARSIAIFSGFTEGVQLFSSFAVLLSFSTRNMLKGVGEIISFSVRDESLHSNAGCWLFRELVKENPEIWDDEMKNDIREAARTAVKLEDDFIDRVFNGESTHLDVYMNNQKIRITAHDIKQFIRFRANTKLSDLGLGKNWKNIDEASLQNMAWFDFMLNEFTDFFSGRVSTYSKGVSSGWEDIFSEEA